MKKPRVLYLDVPFENERGGDKNRSRFIWETLRGAFDTDLLLIQSAGKSRSSLPAFTQYPPRLTLQAERGPFYRSESVFAFGARARTAFATLLSENRYDAVLARFHAPWELGCLAEGHSSGPAVVVDLDMLSSRLVALSWSQNRSFKNRWFLFEKLKLKHLERRLFRRPFLVLFSNPAELEHVRAHVAPQPPPGHLAVLPNVMPRTKALESVQEKSVILFFGSMNSAANTDGFRFLVQDLLPRLSPDLERHGVKIHVVGKNPPAWFQELLDQSGTDRVVVVGGVDSMERAIAESRFVLLPLRIASGTRTRILEAAAQGRAVVTTPIGAEGIEVGEDALVRTGAESLAAAVRGLLDSPALANDLGRRLQERSARHYASDRVASDLIREIELFIHRRQGAAHGRVRP